MIPDEITHQHILEALHQIDASSIPASRQSVDYDLVHAGRNYPPGYVISTAAKYAVGIELRHDEFSSGAETNTFLRKLGFEVVRRPKPGATGQQADGEAVRFVFERLVPEPAARKLFIEIFAETIEQAHAAGEARWEITLHKDFIRLNGGRGVLFDVKAQNAFIAVYPDALTPDVRSRLDATGTRENSFASTPHALCYRPAHAVLVELWSGLRDAFRRFVAEAVLTAKRCAWARFHAPAVVDYVSQAVGRTLPQPVYGEEEPRVNVYFVRQTQVFDLETSEGYLFAPKTDAGGGTRGDRTRVAELVPGDVVVHYAGGEVRAVSRVREAPVDWIRSGDEGWRVAVEVWMLPTPINVSKVFGSDASRLDVAPESGQGPFDKGGDVKIGYLWNFTDVGLAMLRAASPEKDAWPIWARVMPARFWMFHANPDLYDVRAAVSALVELNWNVKQHKSEIRVGDTVFLWESGNRGGIVAIAQVLTEPATVAPDPAEEPFRKGGFKSDEGEVVVRIAIERVLDPIIKADDMRADPFLVTLPAFNSPQRTNSFVSPEQGALLLRWADGKRPTRVVKIAPGDKGDLWGECLDGGYICVGWEAIGDLRQYSDWPSFRKAFGAKYDGGTKGHITLKAQEVWTLTGLKAGDKVVANRGISRVLGVGTVKEQAYVWDTTRSNYNHTVLVEWDTSVACDIPPHKHWGVTTVGKVPARVIALVLPELAGTYGNDPEKQAAPTGSSPTNATSLPSAAPPPESPFASLVNSLQSKESRLWFSEELVAHYVLALQAKRFVILTGVSGTGKTQLALAVAKHFQPRTKRTGYHPPPVGAVAKRVNSSMAQHRRMVLPTTVAMGLQLSGVSGTGSTAIDVEFPGGNAALTCYRDVRSTVRSVHHLSLKGAIGDWIKSLPIGSEIYLELLEPSNDGRDHLRISLPAQYTEVAYVHNYEVVAVRPDWTDGRGLLGFYNPLTRRYVSTPFLRLLIEAVEEERNATLEGRHPTPFFVILDEMNLARVEHYFSDFLSALESGELIVLHDDAQLASGDVDGDADDDAETIPLRVKVPSNLFFTGTVNVDDTTYMFSPKVLDRAFVIEFNEVDLAGYGTRDSDDKEDTALELVSWQGFEPFRFVSADDWDALAKVDNGDVRQALTRLHAFLAQDNRHFGYRVANEIARFITLAVAHCADPVQGLRDALDLAILSKVLPKLHGTQQELEETLSQLLGFTLGSATAPSHDAWTPADGQLVAKSKIEELEEPWLPRSSLKLWRMLKRLRAQGFTSFIE